MEDNLFNVLNLEDSEEGLQVYNWYVTLNEDERQEAIMTADLDILGQYVMTLVMMYKMKPDLFPVLNKDVLTDMANRYLDRMSTER